MALALSNRHDPMRTVLKDSLTLDELADLEEVLAHAQRVFDVATAPSLDELHDFSSASAALTEAWERAMAALNGSPDAAESFLAHDPTSLHDLIERVGRADHMVRNAETRNREAAVRIAWETLAELRDVSSVPQLIKIGSEAVCRLGFDRAIVSQVHESTWLTEAIYVDGDQEWAEEILSAGKQAPQHIVNGLPELDLVRRRRPILVTKVQGNPRVHKAVADASQSRSYVAAPIMPQSQVIGFLHGDRYFHRGELTQFDCDLLGLFAQGFGFALERAMIAQEMAALRHRVAALAGELSTSVSHAPDAAGPWTLRDPIPTPRAPMPAQQMGIESAHSDDRLTRREQEVLRLMAEGETNQRIASRLIISEGTVKSHVKHILRKLQAANRAEAVARWHGARPR